MERAKKKRVLKAQSQIWYTWSSCIIERAFQKQHKIVYEHAELPIICKCLFEFWPTRRQKILDEIMPTWMPVFASTFNDSQ